MRTGIKVALVTVLCTIVAMSVGPETPIGQTFWPAKELSTDPTSAQIAGFIGYSVVASIALGLGVSFLIFGWPWVRRAESGKRWAVATYLSIGWLLVNWYPHDNLHAFLGDNPAGILALMWGFHVTLIAAGIVMARFFLATVKERAGAAQVTSRTGRRVPSTA